MCCKINNEMTQDWRARHRPTQQLTVYKVLDVKNCKLVSEVFRFEYTPGENVAVDVDGDHSNQVGIHCFLSRATALNIWGELEANEVVVPFTVLANDLIGMGPCENFLGAVNTAMFKKATLAQYDYNQAINSKTRRPRL